MSLPSLVQLGKYRELVLAIAVFLVIDMGVLGFNYLTSRLIESDSTRINTAGELRMYSQQLAKAVLSLRFEVDSGEPVQTSLAQISEARQSFEAALGRLTRDLNAARDGFLVSNEHLDDTLEQIAALKKSWDPLSREAATLTELSPALLRPGSVDSASATATARNVRIMQQAGDLTDTLERQTQARAAEMRRIQIIAIILAVLNFIFIVFKFVRSLRQSDRAAEVAREETGRILGAVHEGLFLVDQQFRVSTQQSAALAATLGAPLAPGADFLQLLGQRIDARHLESARDFVDLLFSERVKPALLKQLNPLREIAYTRDDGQDCHLDFEFEQVKSGNEVVQLLVSVVDITERIVLGRELKAAELRAKKEVDALLAILEQNPADIDAFLRSAEARLAEINTGLAGAGGGSGTYQALVRKTARVVHGLKGEAAMLGLTTVEQEIHRFEDVLKPLRERQDLAGDDLIAVAVALNEVHEATAKVWRVVERVRHFAAGEQETAAQSRDALHDLLSQIEQMTLRIASDLDKRARLHVTAPAGVRLGGAALEFLRTSLPQLVRNAIAHGIEPAGERQLKGKPDEGRIHCAIDFEDDGTLKIEIHDDGAGLSPARLRESMLASGLLRPEDAERLSDQQIVARMFDPGFSSLSEGHLHAGRGEGLSVVKEALLAIGGRLRISSQPEAYTRFTIRLNKEIWQCA